VHSRARSRPKYAGTLRLPESASFHEARITRGTSRAINASITSAMPSASNVKRVPHALIHGYDSRNWKRGPLTLNATYMTTVSTKTASDQTSATVLATCGLDRGRAATTAAPTAGATVSVVR
jgi:hypothetical protein